MYKELSKIEIGTQFCLGKGKKRKGFTEEVKFELGA